MVGLIVAEYAVPVPIQEAVSLRHADITHV
jgi:hypothetical protein